MEIKKNPNADLDKKSGLFLNIGLCVSLLLVITAFEWRFYDRGAGMDLVTIEDDFEDLMEIPPTEQPPPPPPVIQQPEIIEVPDEEEIEDCMVAHNMKSDGKICFEEFKLMFQHEHDNEEQ